MLKAEQQDIKVIVEYPLKVKVTILAGYSSSLKMVLWLDTSLCQIVGYSSKEKFAIACAARSWFDEYFHILFILGPVGAISQHGCLPPVMGNDMGAENCVLGRGNNWQAMLLAPMQKSTHFTWACTKVNSLWVLGGKLHLFPSCSVCSLGTFALGQGVWVEIATTFLV